MKLQELANTSQVKQVTQVLESYFNKSFEFSRLTESQARGMLQRIRRMIKEERSSSTLHTSERDPAYLKLIMMEQALVGRLNEYVAGAQGEVGPAATISPGANKAVLAQKRLAQSQNTGTTSSPVGQPAGKIVKGGPDQNQELTEYLTQAGDDFDSVLELNIFEMLPENLRDFMSQYEDEVTPQLLKMVKTWGLRAIKLKKDVEAQGDRKLTARESRMIDDVWYDGSDAYESAEEAADSLPEIYADQERVIRRLLNSRPNVQESKKSRRLREASELQQAQVVLASQDMIDQLQSMIEDVSEMQFKDLPALVDQAKAEVGPGNATQFQQAATQALTALLQAVQQGKTAMEGAQGALTGQAPVPIAGAEAGAAPAGEMPGGEMPGGEMPGGEMPGGEMPPTAEAEPEPAPSGRALGRGRRK